MLKSGFLTALLCAFVITGCAFTVRDTSAIVNVDGRLWKAEQTATEGADGTVGGFRLQNVFKVNGRFRTVDSGFHNTRAEADDAFANRIRKMIASVPPERRAQFIESNSSSSIAQLAGANETFGD